MGKGHLFGGALLTAGITASGAGADFVITGSSASNFIGVGAGGGGYFSIGAELWDETDADGGSTVRAFGEATRMGIEATAVADAWAYAGHLDPIEFELTADAVVTVRWDFSGDLDLIRAELLDPYVRVFRDGAFLFAATREVEAGSIEFQAEAGVTYSFDAVVMAGDDDPGHPGGASFFEITLAPACDGDLDNDNDVDVLDFAILAASFGCGAMP